MQARLLGLGDRMDRERNLNDLNTVAPNSAFSCSLASDSERLKLHWHGFPFHGVATSARSETELIVPVSPPRPGL
jgi:hypothetical protein